MAKFLQMFESPLHRFRDEVVTKGDLAFPTISEAGLARLIAQIQGTDFCIISAYRKENPKAENVRRNRNLRFDLDQCGLGPYPLVGHWREAPPGTNYDEVEEKDLVDVIERSYLVVRRGMDAPTFVQAMFIFAKMWDQDAIVLVAREEGFCGVYARNKSECVAFKTGNISLGQIQQAYSQYVKKINVPFIFEGIETPNATSLALAGIRKQGFYW